MCTAATYETKDFYFGGQLFAEGNSYEVYVFQLFFRFCYCGTLSQNPGTGRRTFISDAHLTLIFRMGKRLR